MSAAVNMSIGHAEAVSKTVSIVKILLMFQHGQISARSSLTNVDPKIEPLQNNFTCIDLSGNSLIGIRTLSDVALHW